MKRILINTGVVLLVSLFTIGFAHADQLNFPDVNPGDWFYEGVMNMTGMGVILGHEDGTFKPADTLNRGELATIMNRYDQNKIQELEQELKILRSQRTQDLYEYETWEEFRNQFGQFPAFEHIPPSYNKMGIDWSIYKYGEEDMENYEVVAVDNSGQRVGGYIYEIIVHKNAPNEDDIWGVYLVRAHYSSGTFLYGPFYNDFEVMVDDIQNNYYDETKSTDPESLKV